MSEFWTIALWNLAALTVMMAAGWLLSLRQRNVTVVDTLWGLGFVLVAWLTVIVGDGAAGRAFLLAVLTTVWGLRLSIYLTRRNHGKPEDPRYAAWRQASGAHFWWTSLFKVFLLQAVFLWAIALALQYGIAAAEPVRLTVLDGVGAVIWLFGFLFETVADGQLARFKSDDRNTGKVMRSGLWALSRHPNYFGEAVLWWGVFVIVLATPNSAWTILSPVIITTVLLKMTGVPITEAHLRRKRPGYAAYVASTNAFIPWFPQQKGDCDDASRHDAGRACDSA